ncbi:reverse transcriptase domain-containing protein [Tanacetum coccineum]
MAAPVISISLDVPVESVGSFFPRVILIGSISVEVPVAPEVGAAAVASPAGVLKLDTHSSSEADSSESSPPPVSVAPMVMAALVISISLDVPVESVGSFFPRVILIGSISVEVSVAPEVGAAAVASPAGVLKLDTHSSSEADPSESLPPPVSVAPMVSPFLCLDDSKSDTEIPERHVSPTTSIPEIPTAPILPAPTAIVAPASEALTARKSVRPLSSHRLALRYSSHHLDHFTSGSSSSHSSSDHSSPGHSISGHSLSGNTPPDTTDADSSTPPRCFHPSLTRTPRDSSSESSARPFRKRCRSPATTVTSFIHATRALVLSRADLLPPRKRFRVSISPEDSVEDDIDTDVLEDIDADVTAVEVVVDRDVEARIDAGIDMEVDVGVDVEDEVEDEVESSDRGTMEVGVDVVFGIDIPDGMLMPDAVEHLEQRELESRSLIAGGERANLLERVASLERRNARLRGTMMMDKTRADRFWRREIGDIRYEAFRFSSMLLCMDFGLIVELVVGSSSSVNQVPHYGLNNMTITRSGMTLEEIEELVNRRVEEALAAYEATRTTNALEAESQSQNGTDDDNGNDGNGNGGDGNGGDGNGGDGNGGNGNGGNGNLNENNRDARPVAGKCAYQDFMKCQPLNFKGTEGVVGLIRWFEKMETVFHISNCPKKYQVKYATCTLLNSALTWWNSHKRTVGTDATFAMSWRELMKLMAEVYCPRTEIQKMESELWNLAKFIGGLLDNIQGNVIAAEPTKLQDVVRIANNLIDQKLKGYAMKNAENKRRLEVNQRDNRGQQPPFKRPNVRGKDTTREQNRGNKAGNKNGIGEVRGKAYVLGGGEANLDSNVIKGTFLLNNHYASMIFDSGTDRSFVSTTFSALLDVTPDTLDVSYAVELADGRISETNTVLRGCTLGLLGHPFNIDLMPAKLGSFDIIIGMDWLANHHAVIMCDEKIMRIPYGDEVLIVQGDRDCKGEKSKLSIISCTKTQKYIKRGCPIFLHKLRRRKPKTSRRRSDLISSSP